MLMPPKAIRLDKASTEQRCHLHPAVRGGDI